VETQESKQGPSLAATVSKIVEDTHKLARQEFGLARSELREGVTKGFKAALGLALGAASTLIGTIALSVGIVAFLREHGVSLSAACIIVSLGFFAGALMISRRFDKAVSGLELESEKSPFKSTNTGQENVRWLKN